MNDGPEHRSGGPIVVVMGVAGSGKTAVGERLAAKLGYRFIEGDRLHPPENVARMAGGLPLTDELRRGWLDKIGHELAESVRTGEGAVAACSALKRIYRERLRTSVPDVLFIYLQIDPGTARRRIAQRSGHFMPASLTDSQFADLQPPEADENALTLDGLLPIDELVEKAARAVMAKAP